MQKYLHAYILLFLLVACQPLPELLATPTPTPSPTLTPSPTPTPTPEPYSAVGFEQFLSRLEATRQADRTPLVNRYLAQLAAAPIREGSRAIFVYQGAAGSVALVGDMNNWDAASAAPLARVPGTELWYLQAEFERDARLDYLFLVEGEELRLDRLNPETVLMEEGPVSVLAMPEYQPPPEVAPPEAPVPAGTMSPHVVQSEALQQDRTVFVYRPAGQLVGESYPSVYIQEGSAYLNLVNAPALLDRLIARGDIPPLIAVFIPPIQRVEEYSRNDAYTRFLAEELVPFIRRQYGTSADPTQTAVLGPGLSGLAAVHAALARPATFGLVAGLSGPYTLEDEALIRQVALMDTAPIRFYLAVGRYETAVGEAEWNILAANRELAEVLHRKGYRLEYEEAPQGHSWGFWRDYFGRALRALFR